MREYATALLGLAFAGCAAMEPSPPIELQRRHDAAPGVAKARLVQALVDSGFKIGGSDQIVAENPAADASWADCDNVLIQSSGTSSSSQRDFARPQARTARVVATVTPDAQGSKVALTTEFAASYTNRYRNLPFNRPCETTGVLERMLLDAAARG